MASFTQQLLLKVSTDTAELSRGLKKVGADTEAAGKKMDAFKASVGKALSIAGSVGVGAATVGLLKKSVNAYGEYVNQVQTATAVFGESYGEIEKTMQNAVEEFGLSDSAFLRSTTYIAGLGKAAGVSEENLATFSTSVTKLGADLAAAFNTDVEQAIGAIQSGFSGSSVEPLRRYNIVINDTALKQEYFALTGEKVTGVLESNQRAAAFMSLLYQQSADYQGQWAKESEQFLGTQQRLGATMENVAVSIGESFEPAVTAAMNATIGAVEAFTSFNDATGGLAGITIAAGAAFLAVAPSLRLIGPAAETAAIKLLYMGESLKSVAGAGVQKNFKSLAKSITQIKPTSIAAAIAVAAVGTAMFVSARRTRELESAQESFIDRTTESADKLNDLKIILDDLQGEKAPGLFDLRNLWTDGDDRSLEAIIDRFKDLARETPAVAAALLEAAERSGPLGDELARLGLTAPVLRTALNDLKNETQDVARYEADLAEILNETGNEAERNADAAEDYAEALEDVADAAEDAKDNIEDLLDTAFSRQSTRLDAEAERLKIGIAYAEAVASAFAPLEEGESQTDRDIANLEKMSGLYAQIEDARSTGIEAAGVTGAEALEWSQRFIDNLERSGDVGPEIVRQLRDDLEAEAVALGVELEILEGEEARIAGLVAGFDHGEVILDMLVDGGAVEEDAATVLSLIPEERQVEIIADVTDYLRQTDQLKDTDLAAEMVINAVMADAYAATDDLRADVSNRPGVMDIIAGVSDVEQRINEIRIAAGKNPIYLQTVVLPPSGGGNYYGNSIGGNVPSNIARSAPLGGGQQIVNTTNVYATAYSERQAQEAVRRSARINGRGSY